MTYDAESDTYRAEFDSADVVPSVAVVEVLASVAAVDPLRLDPLNDVVDLEAIDGLCGRPDRPRREGDRRIEFTCLGYDVTVKSYGLIEVRPCSADADP